jgi:hypothetical protein
VDQYVFGNVTIAAGQFLVLTNDKAAFQTKYGTAIPVLQWTGGSLKNEGESIELEDVLGGVIIHDFSYDDAAPWPTAAAGAGSSLEVINVNGDYSDPANWRASATVGGTPGGDGGTVVDPNSDSDHDGQSDALEAKFGTDPNNPSSMITVGSRIRSSGKRAVSFPSVVGVTYQLEYTDVLGAAWQTATIDLPAGGTATSYQAISTADGRTELTDTTAPASLPAKRFYRVKAL